MLKRVVIVSLGFVPSKHDEGYKNKRLCRVEEYVFRYSLTYDLFWGVVF